MTGPANRFLHGFESGAPELGERRGRPELGVRETGARRPELGERRGRVPQRSKPDHTGVSQITPEAGGGEGDRICVPVPCRSAGQYRRGRRR